MVLNGWMEMVISTQFSCNGLVHHPIDSQPFKTGNGSSRMLGFGRKRPPYFEGLGVLMGMKGDPPNATLLKK